MENQLKMDVKLILKGDELTKEIMVSLPQDPAKLEKKIEDGFRSMQDFSFYETQVFMIIENPSTHCYTNSRAWNMNVLALNAIIIRINKAIEIIERGPLLFSDFPPIRIVGRRDLKDIARIYDEWAENSIHTQQKMEKAAQEKEEEKSA